MKIFPKSTQSKVYAQRTEAEKRARRCAFTGHRPEKIRAAEGKAVKALRKEILQAIDDGYNVFITGMARGVDLWAADIVIALKKSNKDLKLICAIPYEGCELDWPEDWKKHFRLVRKQADYVKVIGTEYAPDIYHKRNKWMVDHCSRLIAVYTGASGGTRATVEYAHSQNIETKIIGNEDLYGQQ